MNVYRISFLSPVVNLTGNERQIAVELAQVGEVDQLELFASSAWIFGADDQTRAVVFEYQH
jgi:hypothetical protein